MQIKNNNNKKHSFLHRLTITGLIKPDDRSVVVSNVPTEFKIMDQEKKYA